jgi:class 3 adenylate cyclase
MSSNKLADCMRSAHRFIALLLLIAASARGYSQTTIVLEDSVESIKIGKSLSYSEDSEGGIPESEILNGSRDHLFIPSEKDALNFGVTAAVVWVKFSVINAQKSPEKILRIQNGLLDNVRLYSRDSSGQWFFQEGGDQFPFRQREIKDHNIAFYINLEPQLQQDFYMRFQTTGSLQIPLEIHTIADYQKTVQISEWSFGLFTGAMFIMILYNLFLFFGLKDYSYLAYSLFMIVNLALMNSYSGHNFQYFLGDYPKFAALSIPLLMALIPFTVSLFSLSFLGPKNIYPSLRGMLYGILGISLLVALVVFVIPVRISTSLAGVLIVFTLVIAITAGISGWVRGYAGARFYVVAWLLLILSGLITAFRNFGILDHNYFTVHGTRIATILEVLLLSFSLASRYRQFRKEKEAAQEQIIAMQQQANIELEKKVKQRTIELSESNEKLSSSLNELEIAKAKSEDLLLNVLPQEIIVELKEKGKTTPRHYPLATVLFTDIKNFTQWAEHMRPEQIVEVLNELFLAFDDICRKHRLEKIKTLGDGYMAVGGLPVKNSTNPADAVRAGLEMQKWLQNWNTKMGAQDRKWEIRVGINSGPVIAGVIGKHKFAYDIWGDAVNIASRMESSGRVGMVNISENTFQYIKDDFECGHLGKVDVKNKGKLDIYHVIREKESQLET